MIAKMGLLLTAAACVLIPLGALANDIEPGKDVYSAIKTANPIVVDGDLSEWASANTVANPMFAIPKGSAGGGQYVVFEPYDGGVWTGPEDQSTSLQVVFDDNNVYVGLTVTDDYHENAANSPWNGDSAQVMIANASRDAQVALYNYALGGVEGALGNVIIQHEAGPGGTNAVITRNGNLTTYEIMLPKESLAIAALDAGVQFGLGMAVNDGDQDTPGQKGWGGLGAHALVFGKTPSETALVTLVPEPSSIALAVVALGVMLVWRRRATN